MSSAALPLFERRLVIVTGKGGTGKTSVVAALALAAARRGRRVAAVEMGLEEQLPRLFGAPAARAAGGEGRVLHPGVTALRVEPYAALGEYLGLQLGGRRVVELALRNRAFRQLMDAAPGWRELITLGKVWHLEQMRERDRPRFDLVLVDAPATGHGLTFLDVPRVAVAAVRMGPLRRHAGWVEELIRDHARTLLLPVALAEELPARETAELVQRARDEIGIGIDRVVVNAVAPDPFPPGLSDLDARLSALAAALRLPGLPPPAVIAACAAHLRQRHALNHHYLGEIGRSTGLPLVTLPLLPEGVRGPADLAVLADALCGAPVGAAA